MPQVKGLNAYLEKFPGRVVHSKYYRSPAVYTDKKVIVIGNSASGYDVARDLLSTARLPVYQSRRSKGRSEGDEPPPGIEWKPVITEYEAATGRITFADGTHLDDVDAVIYCTGYRPSYPMVREHISLSAHEFSPLRRASEFPETPPGILTRESS